VSIDSYTELKTAIADWINRDDISDARLGDFVALAEDRIFRELRIEDMETYVALTADSDGRVTIPADFLEARDVLWDDVPLDRVSLAQMRSRAQYQGKPIAFARDRTFFALWPNPGNVTGFAMTYYARPTNLSTGNASNAVFAKAPALYLYGALVEAGIYLGSPPEKLSAWSDSFADAMARLMVEDNVNETAGSTPLMGSGY
jgi:hypothetical protein